MRWRGLQVAILRAATICSAEWKSVMRLTLGILIVLFVLITGGGVFLAMWDIPAPSATVEKTISDERFPR
jgi:hypothetical protein